MSLFPSLFQSEFHFLQNEQFEDRHTLPMTAKSFVPVQCCNCLHTETELSEIHTIRIYIQRVDFGNLLLYLFLP